MAFLRINGHTVPVEVDSATTQFVEVGNSLKSYDGTTINLRRRLKRVLSFTTIPLSQADSVALEGLVRGEGEYWSYDEASTGEYLYSSRGVGPTTSTGNAQESSNVKYGGKGLDPGTHLVYPASVMGSSNDVTINFWASDEDTNPGSDEYLFQASGNSHSILISRSGSGNTVSFVTDDNSGGTNSLGRANAFEGHDEFKMFTCVIRLNPESDQNAKEFYYNGVRVSSTQSAATAKIPTFSNFTSVSVGNNGGGSNQFTGFMDDLYIAPYAATSDMISGWYNMGKGMSPLPKVYVDGDIIPADTVSSLFIGYVESSQYLMSAGGKNNKRKITIRLEEV